MAESRIVRWYPVWPLYKLAQHVRPKAWLDSYGVFICGDPTTFLYCHALFSPFSIHTDLSLLPVIIDYLIEPAG